MSEMLEEDDEFSGEGENNEKGMCFKNFIFQIPMMLPVLSTPVCRCSLLL